MSSALTLFKEMKPNFEISPYLLILKNKNLRNTLAKLRLSSHQLDIETDRHRNVESSQRKYTHCDVNDSEDEYHFSLICPAYSGLRKIYLQKYFYVRPSRFKFLELLNSTRPKILENFALFYHKSL